MLVHLDHFISYGALDYEHAFIFHHLYVDDEWSVPLGYPSVAHGKHHNLAHFD